MLHRTTLPRLLLAVALVAPSALARQAPSGAPSADLERLRAHVARLASDKLEGRKTGTRGAEEAAAYVAAEFKRVGLEPGGDAQGAGPRSFLQKFPYVAAAELGRGNAMTLARRPGGDAPAGKPAGVAMTVGEAWLPFGFSANATVESSPVVFVGYGVTAAEQNYDDYRDAGAKGKIALAFAGTPDGDNPHGRFARAGEPRFKAAAALAAGAKALVIIADEVNFRDDRLSRLSYDNAGDAGLPVVALSRQAAAQVFGISTLVDPVTELAAAWRRFREKKAAAPAFPAEDYALKGLRDSSLSIKTDVARKGAPAANVVGVLEGSDPKLKDEVIVVGAHYDHLGRGGRGSLAPREGDVHYGADDNASGTAAVVELARLLSRERAGMRRTVVFVAFGGEEEGLLGSKFYVEHPARPGAQTVAMVNLDMVGRLREDALTIGGVGTAAEWRALIEKVNGRAFAAAVLPHGHGAAPRAGEAVVTGADGRVVASAAPRRPFKLRLNEDGFGPSDHASFYARQVPVLFFFTGTHEDYHKPSDTADRVNYDGLARVADLVRDLVAGLQGSDARPTFTRARVEAAARATGFRVYLGTVPSYGDSADGMKLDGVREGSPAEAAGLRAGDVIVKLAGRDIRNVYDYTQALSEMKAGLEYEVEALRAGRRLTLKLTPAERR